MIFHAAAKKFAKAGALADEIPYWGWIDERTALTVGAEMVTVCELTRFSAVGTPEDRREAVITRWTRMLSACPPTARVYTLVLRRPAVHVPPGTGAAIARRAGRLRAEHLRGRTDQVTAYVAFVFEARVQAAKHSSPSGRETPLQAARRRAAAFYRGLVGAQGDEQDWLLASIEAEAERVRREVDALAAMTGDVTPMRVLEAPEASSVLGEIVNRPGYQPVGAPVGAGMNWWLARSAIEIERRNLRLDGEDATVYSLLAPPLEIAAGALDALSAIPCAMSVAWEWRPLEMAKARKRIVNAQRHYFQKRYGMMAHATDRAGTDSAMVDSAAAAEVERLADARVELESDGIAYGELAVTITMHGDLRDIEAHDADLHRVFASSDAKLIRESFGMPSVYFGRLPGQPRGRQVRAILASAGVAACMAPLYGPSPGPRSCQHLDAPTLATLETPQGTPYRYDLFEADVGHTVILGATGSGKSFLANFLLLSALQYDPRVCILDLGGSYQGLTEMVGGEYLALSPDGSAARPICPFALPPSERTYRFLCGWVERLLRIGGYNPSGEDATEIRQRVQDLYHWPEGQRTIGHLVPSLPHRMWGALDRWHGDGAWAPVFDHPPDEWEPADWQVVDLAGAAEHEDLVQAALAYYLERMRLAVDGDDSRTRLKVMLVDEAWRFLRDADTAAWLMEAAKTWRKRNAALLLATQSAADLATSVETKGLIESCPTKIFLANPTFRRDMCDLFGLEDLEADLIRELVPKSELYLRRPMSSEVLRLSVDRRSYWLYTSSPAEADRRARLAAEHGMERAIEMLAGGQG